jgi:hypothetical protein
MKNAQYHVSAAAIVFFCAARISFAELHDIPEHGLRVELPSGWQRIEALSGNTILKLARTETPRKEARIVIVTFLTEDTVDVSEVSRDDHIRALEGGSLLGEEVSVIDVGRTQIDSVGALWGKTHRNLPSRGSSYEYTYELFREYKGIPKGFTIRLTSYGDERWFQRNSLAFDRFMQSIQFNVRPIVRPPVQPESSASRQPVQPRREPTQKAPEPVRFEIKEADPFSLALLKGFGEVFLLILLATIVIGVGKWFYSKYVNSQNPVK